MDSGETGKIGSGVVVTTDLSRELEFALKILSVVEMTQLGMDSSFASKPRPIPVHKTA
jgi:hypothetical protein